MKFKSDIEVQAGLKDSSGSNGTSGQILSSNGTTVSWVPAGSSVASDVQNRVKAGVAINKGQAVYVTSADGTNIIVELASNTTEATSSKTLGLLNATVAINDFADVVQIGKLSGLNTMGATVGDPVWLGTNGDLIYGLANKPYAPAHLVYIGVVTRVNASNGEIFVNVQNGFELDELHNVSARTPSNNNGIFYNTSTSLWEAKSISDAGGIEGSGTLNFVPKWDGSTSLTNSRIIDNGSGVYVGYGSVGSGAAWALDVITVGGTQGGMAVKNLVNNFPVLRLETLGTGEFIQARDLNTSLDVFSVDYLGNTTAKSFIKIGGTSAQILSADGSVITAGTGISISGGVISASGGDTPVMVAGVGAYSIKGNGVANSALGDCSFVGGGVGNSADCNSSFIGGGASISINGPYSSIVGGASNNITISNFSFIGGGASNSISGGCLSNITGGASNYISANNSLIVGGCLNTISGAVSGIVGGRKNSITGCLSFIGGGCCNNACGNYNFIGAGKYNNTSGCYSSILGGQYNINACANSHVIGSNITANRGCTTFVNDLTIVSAAACSGCSVGIGTNGLLVPIAAATPVMVSGAGTCSILGNGCFNFANGNYSFVGGGCQNSSSGTCAFVGGGYGNGATGFLAAAVAGGKQNVASGSLSFVGGGCSNLAYSPFSSVAGGRCNSACGSTSFIGGGSYNLISSGYNTFIGGGTSNQVSYNNAVVVGGCCNLSSNGYSFVGGGRFNTSSGNGSAVIGGFCNIASGCFSSIVGGQRNCNQSYSSGTIAGGCYNRILISSSGIDGRYSFVGGGCNNRTSSNNSVIVGGSRNFSCSGNNKSSFIGGGCCNAMNNGEYSVITGGRINCMEGVASFIGGGICNSVCSSCSSILGGNNNLIPNGYNGTHIIGSNITATAACTTFVNNLTSFGQQVSKLYSAAASGATAIDANNGNTQFFTLSANSTFSITNAVAGGVYTIFFEHGATPSTVSFSTTIKWAQGLSPSFSTALNSVDCITIVFDGTNYYGTFLINFS